METIAVVLKQPEQVELNRLALTAPTADDVVVDVDWSGVSTGTERLLWSGPHAAVSRHGISAGARLRIGRPRGRCRRGSATAIGPAVFIPGATLLRRSARAVRRRRRRVWWCRRARRADRRGARRTRRAAGARRDRLSRHRRQRRVAPDCIVGHGVLGRLLARLAGGRRHAPTVWETNPMRHRRRRGLWRGRIPDDDPRRDYRAIYDVSGDAGLLDTLIGRLAPGRRDRAGRLLRRAGCRSPFRRPSCARRGFASPPNGSRPISIAVTALIEIGRLSLDGLITHRMPATQRAGRLPHRLRRSRPA